MMRALAEWLTRPRNARAVVVLFAAVSVVAGWAATAVDHDDDVLAFLPQDDADVAAFNAINRAFGGLDVAIVGLEADNPLDPELFRKLQDLTQTLNDAPEVKFALSLANVTDFQPLPDGGIETGLLVRDVPEDLEGQRRLRQKVMSRDLVVGQLIAPSGKAVILYAFAAYGADQRTFANKVRREVLDRFPPRSVYLGGAPFVATYIYDSTQADLRRLTPWAVAAIVLFVFVAFRDLRGVVLALVATSIGIVVALGLMVLTGHRYNIVLSSMPVILFSVGSAYGIHVLARYYALAAQWEPRAALIEALTQVGPTVLAAGGTTMVGLLSFLTMDIAPLRSFGLFTAAGIGAALVASLTFVPATVVVFGIRGRPVDTEAPSRLTAVVKAVERHRGWMIAVLVVASVVGAMFVARVDTRMDQSAFFAPKSPPARADRFLRRHFGGALFIQVHAEGDFNSPAVLRAWFSLADRLEALPHVSSVQHVGQVLAQLNAALAAERRVPDTVAQVKLLYRFLAGMPAVDQLVTPDRRQAVMHVKVNTADLDTIDETLAAVEAITSDTVRGATAATDPGPAGRRWRGRYLAGRVAVLARRADVPLPARVEDDLAFVLAQAPPPAKTEPLIDHLTQHLSSPESLVDFGTDLPRSRRVASALIQDAERREAAIIEALGDPDPETVDDLLFVADTVLPVARRRAVADGLVDALRQHGLTFPGGAAGERLRSRLRDELVFARAELPPTEGLERLEAQVSGLPVLHRGLSRSARQNQVASLAVALSAVVVLLCVLFRSVRLGLTAAVPTLFTLTAMYGAMGALGVHLDIGTSMLASLIIGAGVDYAVHLVAAYQAAVSSGASDPVAASVSATGTAIWTNALMVAAGFYLLTLGEARTLQNVGGLTATAMVVAAVSTFWAVPALWPRSVNTRRPDVG